MRLLVSGGDSRHLPAFLRTTLARFGASLAVIGFMLLAFRTARIADFGAKTADVVSELRAAAHQGRRAPADFGTIAVETNALGHLLDITLAQTRVGTMLARLCTFDTSIDTGCILFVSHQKILLKFTC